MMYRVSRDFWRWKTSHRTNYLTLGRKQRSCSWGRRRSLWCANFSRLSSTANDVSTTTYSASLPRDPQMWLMTLFSLEHHRIKLQNVFQSQNSRNYGSAFSAIPPVLGFYLWAIRFFKFTAEAVIYGISHRFICQNKPFFKRIVN